MTYPDGSKYIGGWKDEKRHGQGTYTFSDGEKYIGEFKDGNRHGRGVESIERRDEKIGYWLYDMYVGHKKPEELKEK